jgi:hypothetical protein
MVFVEAPFPPNPTFHFADDEERDSTCARRCDNSALRSFDFVGYRKKRRGNLDALVNQQRTMTERSGTTGGEDLSAMVVVSARPPLDLARRECLTRLTDFQCDSDRALDRFRFVILRRRNEWWLAIW